MTSPIYEYVEKELKHLRSAVERSAEEISIKGWVKHGIYLMNTDALDADDPDHPYNQALAQGVVPEDFGIYHPEYEQYKDMSRTELLSELIETKRQLVEAMKWL